MPAIMKRKIALLGDYVEECLNNIFYRLGGFIGLHPLPFLVIPVIVSCLLSLGMMKGSLEEDVRVLYTPTHAPSNQEYNYYKEFVDYREKPAAQKTIGQQNASQQEKPKDVQSRPIVVGWVQIYFYTNKLDDDNMLTNDRSQFVLDFYDYIHRMNFTAPNGRVYNFQHDVCSKSPGCPQTNQPLFMALQILRNKNLSSNPNIQFDYPILETFGIQIFLGFHIMGVPTGANRSEPLKKAKLLSMALYVWLNSANLTDLEWSTFQAALQSHADSIHGQHDVQIMLQSSSRLEIEVERNALACIPYLTLTFVALVAFTVASTMTSDPITSKSWEAVLGCVACVMAIGSTLGLCFMCGLSFNATVSVMPFLAFAIGVDDTFLAISAWHATDPSLPPHRRLANSLKESGTAITVTSLTDVVLFGLCAISATPCIVVFSIFTAVAMAFDYIYQLTFFTAVMAYAGRREASKANCCCILNRCRKNLHTDDEKKAPMGERSNEQLVSRLIRSKFAPFITHPITKMVVFLLYVLYVLASFYGCTRIQLDMSLSKTVLDDSVLQPYFKQILPRFLWEFVNPQIYVRYAPDFRDETERSKFLAFLDHLESLPESRGPASSVIWFRDFENYMQYIEHDPEEFYTYLRDFLKIVTHSSYVNDLHWTCENETQCSKDPTGVVSSFHFTTAFTTGGTGWENRVNLLRTWRNLTHNYPEYGLVIFDWDSFYIDQYDLLDSETLQQIGIAVIGMTVMAAVFIPNLSSIFWIGWTLLSMDFGVIAVLACWGCDLDPMTMMNIVMSLDFAVEYAAHVCHRYYVSRETIGDEKVIDALGAVGWPVLQGGLAAVIAVLPLVFVKSYIVRAFFKTVVSIVGIGLVHGLIFLPVFVSSLSRSSVYPLNSAAEKRRGRKYLCLF